MFEHQKIKVTLTAATFSRLERGNPFNKRRVGDQAIEAIRVAVLTLYPPRSPQEWKDRSRYAGAGRTILFLWYDLVCYLLRKLMGRSDALGASANHVSDQPVQITLKVPIGLVNWIEKIAHSQQSTIPDATVYAIEYGLRVLDSQRSAGGAEEDLRKVWRDIFHAIWKRVINVRG